MGAVNQSRQLRFQTSFSTLLDKVDARVKRTPGRGFFYAILFVTFLFLISSSTMLFRYHLCKQFPEADGRTAQFLADDLSIDCNGKEWKSNFPYVMIMVSFMGHISHSHARSKPIGTYEHQILLTQ